jgi:hypothetical protein
MSEMQNTPFSPPRHWIGVEELNADYWSDPKIQERRGQEFHDKPIDTVAMIEKLDTQGIARRDFLTIMGASMAMASFACARRPVHKIIPYVVKPEEITPGDRELVCLGRTGNRVRHLGQDARRAPDQARRQP